MKFFCGKILKLYLWKLTGEEGANQAEFILWIQVIKEVILIF